MKPSCWTPYSKKLLMKHYPFPCFHDNAVVTEDPIAYLEEHDLPLTKLHGDGDPASYPLKELAALEGVSLTASSDRDFELVPAKVGKGRTLALMSLLRGGAPGAVRRRGGQPQRPVHAGGGGNPPSPWGKRQFPGEGGRPACGGGQRPRRRGRGHPVVFSAERVMLKTLIKKESRRRCPDISGISAFILLLLQFSWPHPAEG